MSDPRWIGLTLMAIAVTAFVGTTSEMLPSVAFFPALVLFGAGALRFLRGNHDALEKAEKRVDRALNPILGENRSDGASALRQANRRGAALNHAGALGQNANRVASNSSEQIDAGDSIEFDRAENDFVVATDVSFPVEIQSGDALADQLRKLNRLLEQGILTAEEYAVAKAKILS